MWPLDHITALLLPAVLDHREQCSDILCSCTTAQCSYLLCNWATVRFPVLAVLDQTRVRWVWAPGLPEGTPFLLLKQHTSDLIFMLAQQVWEHQYIGLVAKRNNAQSRPIMLQFYKYLIFLLHQVGYLIHDSWFIQQDSKSYNNFKEITSTANLRCWVTWQIF